MRTIQSRGKRDASEPAVIQALEKCGWTVQKISAEDFGDLVAAKAWRTIVVEVKSGKAKLRPRQQQRMAEWPGEWFVIRTAEEAASIR